MNKRRIVDGFFGLLFSVVLLTFLSGFTAVKPLGRIITVDSENREIFLGIGKKDGVRAGDHFVTYRETNPYVTSLEINKVVDGHLSIAILPRSAKFVPQEGDFIFPFTVVPDCLICHYSSEPRYQQESTHRVVLSVRCRTCHGSHQPREGETQIPNQVRCGSCHDVTLAGTPAHQTFLNEGCQSCHKLHPSPDEESAGAETDGFCVSCHPLDALETLSAHNNFLPTAGKCSRCHDPHNKQEGKYLYPEKHPPFEEGSCDVCHPETSSPGAAVTLSPEDPSKLCYECHDEFPADEGVTHLPVVSGDCLSCHSPHLSKRKHFLSKSVSSMCLGCHSARFSASDKHKPVVEGKCLACHRPHQSPLAKLLREPAGKLCRKCHTERTPASRFPHVPYAEKNCTACHLPHSSSHKYQFRDNPTRICLSCHTDLKKTSKPSHQKMFDKPVPPGFPRSDYKLRLSHKNLITCYTCHEPHYAMHGNLLREKPEFLCTLCHSKHWLKVFNKEN